MATKSPTAAQKPVTETKPEEKPAEENKDVQAPVETTPEAPAADKPAETPAGDQNTDAQKSAAQKSEDQPSTAEAPVVKSGFYKVQIENFRGSYGDAKFDDHGVCERISKETLSSLGKQFPGAKVLSADEID